MTRHRHAQRRLGRRDPGYVDLAPMPTRLIHLCGSSWLVGAARGVQIGGYRSTAETSDCHGARLAFQILGSLPNLSDWRSRCVLRVSRMKCPVLALVRSLRRGRAW